MRPRLRAVSRERISRPRSTVKIVVPDSMRRGGTPTIFCPTRHIRTRSPRLTTSTFSNVTLHEPSPIRVPGRYALSGPERNRNPLALAAEVAVDRIPELLGEIEWRRAVLSARLRGGQRPLGHDEC